MTLRYAKLLRDAIRSAGVHCIVPLGHGPGGYFARIWTVDGIVDFWSRAAWQRYVRGREKRLVEAERAAEAMSRREARSPIDMMIDRACGAPGA